ncbi:MAG: calcium-transporting P-type ATPase, PMR1-type [Bacteroidales bacterium]|nr:calcium-transporting P-type ATPase, PMR1-type [Bacteroidales bacterium]
MERYWKYKTAELAELIKTNAEAGLTMEEAEKRLEQYGPNQLEEKRGRSAWGIFFAQFNSIIIWILFAAALISGFLKEWVDSLAICGIIVLNSILGYIQEFRAEKSLAALKKLSSPSSRIIRGGKSISVPSGEIVPGDLIELDAGDKIPADSRLVYTTGNFATQEASLTGESVPVNKTSHPINEDDIELADRINMVYMGTAVVSGKARAIVISTGMQTELGRIADMIQEIKEDSTPLQKRLEQFGKWIVIICIVLVALVFLLGYLRGGTILDLFLTSVSLAVAAIPEGLPAVVTIALALGVQRMVKRHCLIRKLPSVETLGCTNVICSDKTGTLTRNEMTAKAVYVNEKLYQVTGIGYEPDGEFQLAEKKISPLESEGLSRAMDIAVLCNGAKLIHEAGTYRILGDPTEAALLTLAAKAGVDVDNRENEFPFVAEIPFDSERKQMTIIRRKGQNLIAFVKGAPDVLLSNCTLLEGDGRQTRITSEDRERILSINNQMADQAMRVLGIAYRELETTPDVYEADTIERDLIFAGLIAMIDPPREEVKLAIEDCQTAGIRSVMITGDHKNTAVAIARELGFFGSDTIAMTGNELDSISHEEFESMVDKTVVYARVSPEHKLRIVKAWRKRGQVVAMTGDGVNDAPAIKEADIGVAMGITGTDVTKEVSDMVILDDNFASIVAAVEEGRGIYDNIKKFIHYLLSCNAGEIMVMFVASIIGFPIPLLPIHILWVNLVTDGLPALALGMDPIDKDVMKKPPRLLNESIITRQGGKLMLTQGAFIAFCALLAFWFVLSVENEGLARARTACFIVLACSQLFHSFNCRSSNKSLFTLGVLSNKKLVVATLFSFALQMMVVYVPFLQTIFKTEALGWFDWILVLVISSFPFWAMEVVKLFQRIGRRSPSQPHLAGR